MALVTNDEVLAVDQHSENNHQLFRTNDGLVAWVADVPGSQDKYLAVFNTRDAAKDSPKGGVTVVPVKLSALGFTGSVRVRDLWTNKDAGSFQTEFAPEVPSHGARLFRVNRFQ
jgi:hypothetical protein